MSRTIESIKKITQDNSYKNITRNYVLLVLTVIVALALLLAIAGSVLNGGILPNAYQGLGLIVYPTEQKLSPQSSAPQTISAVPQTSIDFGTLEGKVLGPTGLPVIGASVIAQKELGVITSIVKEGGFTGNSSVTADGSYSFNVDPAPTKSQWPSQMEQIKWSKTMQYGPALRLHMTSSISNPI